MTVQLFNGTSHNECVTSQYVIKQYILKQYMSHNSTTVSGHVTKHICQLGHQCGSDVMVL
jgi:hypothetical protein